MHPPFVPARAHPPPGRGRRDPLAIYLQLLTTCGKIGRNGKIWEIWGETGDSKAKSSPGDGRLLKRGEGENAEGEGDDITILVIIAAGGCETVWVKSTSMQLHRCPQWY